MPDTPPTPEPSQPSAIAREIVKNVMDDYVDHTLERSQLDSMASMIDRVLARHSAGAGSKADPFAKAKDDRPAG